MSEQDKNSPAVEHPAVKRMSDRWERCRDLFSGTDAIQSKRNKYLPRHPREEQDDYDRRAKMAEVFNAFARTVRAFTGMVMQVEPVLGDDVSATFKEHWENIDGVGTHGSVFARRLLEDGLVTGLGGILVEYPTVDEAGTLSRGQERALGLRPYWIPVAAEEVVSWRTAFDTNGVVLTQFVLKERIEEPDGEFGVRMVTQYRVFQKSAGVVSASLWKVMQERQAPTIVSGPTALLNQVDIPFAPFLAGTVSGYLESEPPLLDLADVNLGHWRLSAERRWVMHLACVPIPVRTGYPHPAQGEEMAIGPSLLQDLPIGGDFKWVEPAGTAFEPTQVEIEGCEKRMGALGMAFLSPDTRQAETAEAKRLDKSAENATLASTARALQDCLERAAVFHCAYTKDTPGSITVNTEFERTVMSVELANMLANLEVRGQLTIQTLLQLLERGHVLPDGFDLDAEVADLTNVREDREQQALDEASAAAAAKAAA